jgi:DNA-binding transcriptional LysR family regulator
MELIYLQTFREVALRKSFTRAAEELGYAQSSVTTQIQKLEKAYGVELFERFGRGLNKIREGELDLGLILASDSSDSLFQWTALREEQLVLIANPLHPLASLEKVELQHLAGREWFMSEDSCNYRIMPEKVLRASGIEYSVGLELGNPEAIKRCLMASESIAILPHMAAKDEIRRGELTVLPFSHHDIRLELQLVMHPKKWISHALGDFMNRLRSSAVEIGEALVEDEQKTQKTR